MSCLMAAFSYVSHIPLPTTPVRVFQVMRQILPRLTDLLRSKIMPDDILKTLANPLLGDGGKVALGQNIINDCSIFVAEL